MKNNKIVVCAKSSYGGAYYIRMRFPSGYIRSIEVERKDYEALEVEA